MKAIITDLDRTLLHTDKSLSDYTAKVFHECRAQGIYVMAATARPMRSMRAYHDQIGFDAITAMNGAIVSLPNRVMEFGISRESGRRIVDKLLCHPDVLLSIETSEGFYANRDIPEWQPIVYDGFPDLPEDIILYKILASSPRKALYEGIEAALTEDVYHTVANQELIQIMSRKATKWQGIQQMLACYGVAPEDAVYFGDDQDDIKPIRKCGLGIAVVNAIPPVLDVADDIAESNDMDGVARYIEKRLHSSRSREGTPDERPS